MKLVRYTTATTAGIGALVGKDLHATPWVSFEQIFAEADPLAAVAAHDAASGVIIAEYTRLAPTIDRATVIGTGGNYPEHSAESATVQSFSEPIFFPFLWSAVIGPDQDIVIPNAETLTDYEVEFSIVIGRTARNLTEENAMDYVFGYTVLNDVSARQVSMRERMQMTLAKSPDTFAPIGPHVVTKDEVSDPYALEIASYLNGEVRQHAKTGDMQVRIPEILAFLTQTITLHPGDIVTTGTPGGVGFFRTPQEFMKPGDTIAVEVQGIGRMTNRVTQGW